MPGKRGVEAAQGDFAARVDLMVIEIDAAAMVVPQNMRALRTAIK